MPPLSPMPPTFSVAVELARQIVPPLRVERSSTARSAQGLGRVALREFLHLDAGLRCEYVLGEATRGEFVQRPFGVLDRERHQADAAIWNQIETRRNQDPVRPAAQAEERREQVLHFDLSIFDLYVPFKHGA